MKAKLRVSTVVLFLLIVIVLALATIHFWHAKNTRPSSASPALGLSSASHDPAVPVQIATVRRETVPQYITALGTVTASAIVTVRSRVDGQLMALHFREGDSVTAGQLLAEIDPRPFNVALLQAQGQLAKDQATLNNSRNDLRRYQKLATTKLVSQQDLDNQQALVRESEGTVKSDQAAVDNAQLNLTYSRITAPIAGRVGFRQVDAGNYITAGDTTGIVVITRTHPIDVIFTVPEAAIEQVVGAMKQGQPLLAEAWDRSDNHKLAEGSLLSLDNQIDSTTGTLKIKARFANQDDRLFPNQFVNLHLRVSTLTDALLMPVSALQMNNEGNFVWIVSQQNTVSRKQVSVGLQQNQQVVVTAGLSAGDRVITDGIDRLTEGSAVNIVQGSAAVADSDAGGTDQ
ncbi:MdtA/MuxA family multidrug efflux RND transporter periplasmic adaptor subunit [Tatumella sp. UBA2305]|uniref:MdtA/MuxA family multidrug efflux RND transporter periplasmic adaptor subunit n=1 Tax=Tatumella sp. UBA2305 TaxID=1947647 RepID=UPI0025E6C271|nr:MdtA/MuxA family multidrug efflux RND transporter periplasmic adaptor subunit [Tatumella sp. UBA2305]